MHDLDRMKTKVEIRLGASQVLGLAVGTAAFSALLFVAGYLVGKQQVPTVAPAPDLARLLGDTGEEGIERGPARAAVGEVEFLFPKAEKKAETPPLKKNRDVRLPAAVLKVDVPKVVRAKQAQKAPKESPKVQVVKPRIEQKTVVAKDTAKVSKSTASTSVVAGKLSATTSTTDGVSATQDAPKAMPAKASKTPKASQTASKELAKAEESDPDEDRPDDDGDVIPSVKLPKIETTKNNPRLAKKIRVPKVNEALEARRLRGTQRQSKTSMAKTKKKRDRSTRVTRGRFTLQVKATKTKSEAESYMASLRRSNFFPHLIVVDTPKKGRFYRIRVGRFETMEEARAFQREFSSRSGQDESGYVTRL